MQKIVNFKQNLDYYIKLIDTRTSSGDYLGALDAGRRAYENAKTRIDRESINILIGQIYYEMGLYALSCEHFFRAVRIPETRAGAFFGIGRNLVKMNNPKLALEYFEATLDIGGTQDFSGAVLEWTYEIKQQLQTPMAENNTLAIARNLVKMHKADQAVMLLSPLANNNIDAKIMLADVLVLAEQYARAREILFDILRDNPANVQALLVLCSLCLAEKDLCSLEINLQKIAGIPLKFNQLVLVGNMYAAISKFDKAITFYQKAQQQDEYNTKILLFLAIAYYNLGDTQEALYYIGQARWVDIENPVLNIYYDIFSRNLVEPPLAIVTQIPHKIAESKLQAIFSAINSDNFCDSFNRSLLMADDIEWCFMQKNPDLTNRLAKALSRCKKKKAVKLYQKLLISVRLNKEQKFSLTKYAMLNENVREIDLTSNYRYRSFKTKLPSAFRQNAMFREGYENAFCFAEINGMDVNLDKITEKLTKNQVFSQILPDFDENVLACLYFCENAQVLNQACIYFGVDSNRVIRAINEYRLLV